MKRAGVIGWPVEHSLSPVLHGYWLKQYGIEGAYEKIAAAPEDFAATVERLRAEGYAGVNVTVPHKEAAFALAQESDPAAKSAGAANLLTFQDGLILARNTDALGLQQSLQESLGSKALKGQSAILLGAGGAARAAILSLKAAGVRKIYILARNMDRATALAEQPTAAEFPAGWYGALGVGTLDHFPGVAGGVALLVNATSAGMGNNPALDLDLSVLPPDAAVCDIVYHPLETRLLKDAKRRGLKTIDGLGMLMHQAAPSFAAFFGIYPGVTPGLRATLVEALGARQ